MAQQVCANDLVVFSVGAPACPQCGSTERVEQDSPEHEALLAERTKPAAKKATPKQPGDEAPKSP